MLTVSTFMISCEKDNYTPDTYFPKEGDKIEKVEKYWGQPSRRTVSSVSGTSYITYFYDGKRVMVTFRNYKVDSYTSY